jgi:hypothetical protein
MKKISQKVITFCFSILISLVCVEMLFRAYIPFSRTAQLLVSGNDWKQNPEKMKSLEELRVNNPNFLLPSYSLQGFTTNSQGMNFPAAEPAGYHEG